MRKSKPTTGKVNRGFWVYAGLTISVVMVMAGYWFRVRWLEIAEEGWPGTDSQTGVGCFQRWHWRYRKPFIFIPNFDIRSRKWLTKRLTPAEAEAANMVEHSKLGPKPVPFGFCHEQWLELQAKMQKGDQLWEFRSSSETWDCMAGRAGIALIRRGSVVYFILTVMN